jgi:hypothetical protein
MSLNDEPCTLDCGSDPSLDNGDHHLSASRAANAWGIVPGHGMGEEGYGGRRKYSFSLNDNTLSGASQGRIQHLGRLNGKPQAHHQENNAFQTQAKHYPLNTDLDRNQPRVHGLGNLVELHNPHHDILLSGLQDAAATIESTSYICKQTPPSSTSAFTLGQGSNPFCTVDYQLSQQQAEINTVWQHNAGPQPASHDSSQRLGPFLQTGSADSPHVATSFQSTLSAGDSPCLKIPKRLPVLIVPSQDGPSHSVLHSFTQPHQSSNAAVSQTANSVQGPSIERVLSPGNPASTDLSDMWPITPIATSVNRFGINIQPGTPVVGINDGRGSFEGTLGPLEQMAHVNHHSSGHRPQDQKQQSDQQLSGPQAQNSSSVQSEPELKLWPIGPISHSVEGCQSPSADVMQQPCGSNWLLETMQSLSPKVTSGTRGKSNSYVSFGRNDAFDRQALLHNMRLTQNVGNIELIDMENAEHGQNSKTGIHAGRAAPSNENPQQSAPPPKVESRKVWSNDAQPELMTGIQQQHQRSQMSPLPVNVETVDLSGVFKFQSGGFSPTSLTLFNQQGVSPADAAPPFFSETLPNVSQAAFQQTPELRQQTFLAPEIGGPGFEGEQTRTAVGLRTRRLGLSETI